jgi:hypothetical protein
MQFIENKGYYLGGTQIALNSPDTFIAREDARMYRRLRHIALAAALLLSAQAQSLPLTVTGFEYPGPTTVQITNTSPTTSANVYAGGFRATAGGDWFTAWCVDIFQQTIIGETVNDYSLENAVSALGASKIDALGRLATLAYGAINNAATSGAFQIAIWEIINEVTGNPYNLAAGNFKASNGSNGAIALAQSWLDNLGAGPSLFTIDFWKSPTRQDLIVFRPIVSVPEPAGIALLALGLLTATWAWRRRLAQIRR